MAVLARESSGSYQAWRGRAVIALAFVDLASDVGLKPGLIETGLSNGRAGTRLRSMGRPSAVPGPCKPGFSIETIRAEARERAERAVELTAFQKALAIAIGRNKDLRGPHDLPG